MAQQVLTSFHRLRSGWMVERTARLNALRGLLRELGVFIPVGAPLRRSLPRDPRHRGPCQARRATTGGDGRATPRRGAPAHDPRDRPAHRHRPGRVHRQLHRFPSGRHLASWLGLTPREYSSGLKRYLGRISKRGDRYLHTLLIHGARSVLLHARQQQPDRLREWAHQLGKTHVHNKAAVAVANKLARIVWAVWSRQQPFGQSQRAA